MTNFLTMCTRVGTELRRANLQAEIKQAVNDAIKEAATTRYYFNEVVGVTFVTVPGQEYYTNLGLTEIDTMYFRQGGTSRLNFEVDNNLDANARASGNNLAGETTNVSVVADKFRLYPIPSTVFTVIMDGYGTLTPFPMVLESATNAWMTAGEMLIRALAKRNIQRDVVRDYEDAAVLDAIAADYSTQLLEATTNRIGTGRIQGTLF